MSFSFFIDQSVEWSGLVVSSFFFGDGYNAGSVDPHAAQVEKVYAFMSLTESLIKHAFFLGGIVAENECITI